MAEERLNGLDYTAQSWNVGDPITQSRMMNIENAIETAFYRLGVKADTGGYGGSLQNLYTTLNNAITEVRNTANQAANDVSTATQNTMDGQHAWAALTGAGVIYDTHNGTFNPSLANILLGKADQTDLATEKERIDSIIATIGESGDNPTGLNKRISDINSSITAINTNINGAKDPNVVNDTLGARFDRIEGRISVNTGAIDTLNNSSGNNYATLAERLAAIDNNQLGGEPDGFRTLPAVDSELKAARGKDANDNDYATLSARLGANDTKVANVKATADNAVPKANIVHDLIHNGTYEVLGADQGAVITNNIATAKSEAIASANTYADTKIADTKIADNLTTDTPGYVLGAGQGKALNTRLSNAEAEIAAAHVSSVIRTNDAPTTFSNGIDERFENIEGIGVAAKNEIEDAHRTDLGVDETTGLPIQDTLRTRFEAIESAAAASDNAIDGRLDALEDNVNGAKVQDGPQTLDARFDAVESRATQLETDVSTIANELSMVNTQTNAIQNTNSRIDTIEENVVAIGKEIGMLQDLDAVTDLSTAVSRNDTDIDKIKSELNDARIQIGTDENEDPIMGTLDDRFDANESDIAAINAKIGGNYDSTNTVTAAITAAITASEAYTDTQNTTNKVTQIAEANREHSGHFVEDEETHEQVEVADTLDLRFDDIEGRLDAIDTPSTGAIAGLTGRIGALETSVDTQTTGLKDRMTAAETAINHVKDETDVNDKGGLEQRMDAAEAAITTKASQGDLTALSNTVGQISTTIVLTKTEVNFNNDNEPTTFVNGNIIDKNDYLIQSPVDDKYYYWKHINDTWHLMGGAGGGGTGNTSGFDLTRAQYTALASTTGYNENTDYYVTEESGLIRHYRYVTLNNILTEIEIGPLTSNIKRYNISSGIQTVKVDGVDTDVTYLYLHEFAYGEDNSEPDANTILTSIPLPTGGGAAISTQKMVRITERNITQPLGAVTPVELKFFYTSGVAKESGIGELYVDDVLKVDNISITSGDPKDASSAWPSTSPLPDGFYSIDVSEYCTELGTKQFRIKISDPDDETGTMWKDLKWDVNVMNLTISSTFTEHSVNTLNSTVKFIYTANGDIDKVVNFKLGDTLLPTVSLSRSTSGTPQEYNISMPQAGAGAYRLEVWLTATANGHDLPPSQSIYRDIIWYDASSSDMIMSSPYRDNVDEPVTQYNTLEIPYTIVGGTAPYTVYYYVDDMSEPINEITLTGNTGVWEFRADEDGAHNLKIACGTAAITFSIDVTELPIDIAPETINLILDFNPQGITNTSNKRLWTNGTYHMTVSNNFDWYNGGYGSDSSGDYFLVKAGTRAVFDYKMFTSTEGENNAVVNEVFQNGKEMKIIFKTAAVRNADAVWFTNMGPSSSNENAKQVGIQLGAHNGFLKTDAASNTAVGGVAATNTYLYFPYSEEDKIELDININKASENNNFIMSYEDGCPSKAYPYKTSEILYHIEGQEQDITIGSDDCDVYIYRMRIYDAELTTEQVLRNFIADGKNSSESIDRYNRNCIFYDTNKKVFTPYTNNNTILDPERLAIKIPDVKVLMLETPRFTTSKKDFVPYSSLRCIHAPGGKYFKSRGKEDNWLFRNGYHAGQGTTSDKYGNAGRNLDFLFMCDGIHNPSDKVKPDKGFIPGYQSSLILGYGTEDQQAPTYCLDWKDEDTWVENKEYEVNDLVRYGGEVYKCIAGHTSTSTFDSTSWALQEGYTSKITLTSTSIPNNFFNLKVNIASSENANNALLQKRYNDFLLYSSPAHERDSRIKNDMEFVPAVIFVRETGVMDPDGAATAAERKEFNDDQWHFYALGNIGDSKKTDYTRAYDPQDMNEFTLEISDNNTNNSQFQSGVYMANYYRLVNNPVIDNIEDYYVADGITGTVEYNNETQYYGNFIKTLDTEIDNEHTYYTFIEQRRAIEPYTLEQDMDDGKPVEGSFTARSAAGQSIQTTEYLFPLQEGEWNSNNMRYWSLFNEGFDGDHSFEMRYACKGDYRDGKVVNDTTGKAKAQLKLNEGVWRAFYTWLVTSDNSTFVNELDQWVVRSSVEYYYAFTHYYTMMDNRAKNTFWHFAKTGKHRKVTTPVAALLHIYEEADGTVTPSQGDPNVYEGTFVTTSDATIDNNKQYYTQYAFDMWVYDTDTALGIDNNGELVFPYGKEDTDYRIEGDASSSMVFNGAGSIFWCRLRDNCIDDIRGVFTSVQTECFNANTLINEFDKWQECYPEAIWRLDVERKYIRSFTGDTGPNGVYLTRKETRFLRDMMQGRKKYQRRQWVKDQDIYFGSKYMLPSVRDDFFEFSCYQPAGQAVTPNWDLTITPYQDMYINISYAETFASPFRAKAGVTYEFKSLFDQMNDSRIRVFGANHIQGLAGKAKREDPNDPEKITGADGLASFYIKANNFEHGKKLRRLILGTDNTSYQNGNFTTLNIANDYPILEVFNIKNCGNLGGALDLSKSTALKTVEAQGTQITQILLPSSTGIETLHLPETVTKVELKSAKQLNEITIKNRAGTADYSNLTQLDIDDSDYSTNINWMTLAATALNHLDLLSILNMHTSSINNIDELEPFKIRKEAINRIYLGGNLTVNGNWSNIEKVTYENVWSANNLNLVTNIENEVTRYKVIYKLPNDVDNGRELYTVYLTPAEGQTIVSLGSDPAYVGTISSSQLVKPSTVSTEYIFGQRNSYGYMAWTGWRKSTSAAPVGNNTNIDGDTILIAIFNEKTRSYPIHWYLRENDNTPVRISDNILYGGSYVGVAPTVYDLKNANKATYTTGFTASNTKFYYSIFEGWDRLPINLDSTCLDLDKGAFCIYGRWTGVDQEHAVLVSDVLAQETFTTEKLLLLSVLQDNVLSGETPYVEVGETLDLTLGYDSIEPGTLLIGEGSNYIMNNTRTYDPTVSFSSINNPPPFSSNIVPFTTDHEFTLAIDYRFDKTAISNAGWSNGFSVLAGCYEKVNGAAQGFSLYYDIANGVPKVCFGDQSVVGTFTNATYSCALGDEYSGDTRNIIVLRHPKNSSTIEVYSGIYSSSNILPSLDNAFFVQELTWSANTSAAKLCFGNLVPDGTSAPLTQIRQGLGTIYWVKYWDKDLGQSECTQLASWPHEKIRFAVEDYPNLEDNPNTTEIEGQIINTSSKNIFFTALQLSQYGGPSYSLNQRGSQVGEIQSWEGSLYKDISNKRFFLGLPVTIQSIINKTEGHASAVICQQGTYNGKYVYYTDYSSTDYVFLPSYPEVTGSTGAYYESEAYRGMPWFSAGNTKVISYVNTNFNFNSPTTNVQYMNFRFPGVPINLGLSANTVYINYTGSDSVYNKIGSTRIKRGDIFIKDSIAYIYADDEDVRNGAPIINASSGVFSCEAGGWVKSKPWWTRTVMEMDPATSYNSFYFINSSDGQLSSGVPVDNNDGSGMISANGAWFVFTFGI